MGGEGSTAGGRAFELKPEHFRVLAAMSWGLENGVPFVDPERPFGRRGRSNILLDVWQTARGPLADSRELTDGQAAEAANLLEEASVALLVILTSACAAPGFYHSLDGRVWEAWAPATTVADVDRWAARYREQAEQLAVQVARADRLDAALAHALDYPPPPGPAARRRWHRHWHWRATRKEDGR